jgi:hypothetical protein
MNLFLFMLKRQTNKSVTFYHFPLLWRFVHSLAQLRWLVLLLLAATSCTSSYHRAQAQLPAEPAAALNLRLAEAEQAQRLAREAAQKLCNNLLHGDRREDLEVAFDRLEAAAYELQRRVLAASDAEEKCGKTDYSRAAIERLNTRALAWIAYVETHRDPDAPSRVGALEVLLE